MFGLLKSLFLTPDRASDAIDKASKGIDALVNTKEERGAYLLSWVQTMGATNVARRVVAFAVTFVWLIYQLTNLALIVLKYNEIHVIVTSHITSTINPGFLLVMAFYFAPHTVAAYKGTTSNMMKDLKDGS